MPLFAPVRVRGGRHGLRRLVLRRRRALATGLAVTAAALVAAVTWDGHDTSRIGQPRGHPAVRGRTQPHGADAMGVVTAPVRIADAATVRLLRPGDRVDVIAAEDPATGAAAHVVARGARVAAVPDPVEDRGGSGALVALSVPRAAAARLAGAAATARLAVTLW
ncbi:hypothetical protein [Streptomyces tropicalis]|uniref:Flp pilus assembly protein RcpC/CpaB domain-containing protein n=1 Tax=Streptomyces tropicalis TaxID=3034234 RepID=A0ABT6ADU7_9ACTN|nr:hypothetical protein [Streptomyces tropicalis]MDF3302830.1 hypothetical protein [Streptomyces tropicalis]